MPVKSAEIEACKVADDYMEAIRKLLEDEIKNDIEKMKKAADELQAAHRQVIRKLLEDEIKNDIERERKKAADELQVARRQAIRKLLEDDIRHDVEKEMRKAADELLAARRQAINQLLKEQRQVVRELVKEEKKAVWVRLEDLRDSISNYSKNKMGEADDSNAGTDLGGGSIVIHNGKSNRP